VGAKLHLHCLGCLGSAGKLDLGGVILLLQLVEGSIPLGELLLKLRQVPLGSGQLLPGILEHFLELALSVGGLTDHQLPFVAFVVGLYK